MLIRSKEELPTVADEPSSVPRRGYLLVSATLLSEELELDDNEVPVPRDSKCVRYEVEESRTLSLAEHERVLWEPGYTVTGIHVYRDTGDEEPF